MTRFHSGQRVVLPGGILGDVASPEHFIDGRVRVDFLGGGCAGMFHTDELKTRGQALHHYLSVATVIAQEIGDNELRQALFRLAEHILRAAELADDLDEQRAAS